MPAPAAADLADVHLEACRSARPDPSATAQWLADRLLDDASGLYDLDPADYREVLGDTGRARLREPAEQGFRQRPKGWAEQHLLERSARADGDLDEVIRVWSADLPASGTTHLRIAEELTAAGGPADALAVYRRRIDALAVRTGNGTYEAIADLLEAARACHRSLGTEADFTACVAELRAAQRRKRNLLKILDARGL